MLTFDPPGVQVPEFLVQKQSLGSFVFMTVKTRDVFDRSRGLSGSGKSVLVPESFEKGICGRQKLK